MTSNSAPEQEQIEENQKAAIFFYFSLRPQIGFRWVVGIVMLAASVVSLSAFRTNSAEGTTLRSPTVEGITRPCTNIPTSSKPAKGENKKGKKQLEGAGANAALTCLEIHSTALEVQEYLQAYGREQKWNLIDEHVAADAWTFSRKLEKEELLRYSKNDASTDHVSWTSGVAFVEIKTMELAEGFVRVQIAARFQGYGQNADRFAPPKEFWPLISNGTLENHLISVLEAHFKNLS
jgi:hypothetical protein